MTLQKAMRVRAELKKMSAVLMDLLKRVPIQVSYEKEKYRWAYGRKWRPKRMPSSLIKLPIRKDDNEEIIPDWDFMESFIKTLPYSSCL